MTKTQSMVTKVARQILDAEIAKFEAYEREVEEWYAEGDGRPVDAGGKGYTFPACIHGTSRWTDYDNICGPCEDGWGYFDWHREARYAVESAKYRLAAVEARQEWYRNCPQHYRMPDELNNALIKWIYEPILF